MRARYASGIADEADHLPALHDFADVYQRLAQVKVRCHDSATVIDVYDVAGEKEVVDQSDHTAICCLDRLPHRAAEINTQMTRSQLTIEQPTRAKLARDHRIARPYERRGPHWRSLVRCFSNFPRARV